MKTTFVLFAVLALVSTTVADPSLSVASADGDIVFAFSPLLIDPTYEDHSQSPEGLKYGVCNNAACSNPDVKTLSGCIVSYDPIDQHTSIAQAANGKVWVAFTETQWQSGGYGQGRHLAMAKCDDASCDDVTIQQLSSNAFSANILMGPASTPMAFFVNGQNGYASPSIGLIEVANCNGANCNSYDDTIIDLCGYQDGSGGYCRHPHPIDDPISNNPVIAYFGPDVRNQSTINPDKMMLKLALCSDRECQDEVIIKHLDLVEDGSTALPYRDSRPAISFDSATDEVTIYYTKGDDIWVSVIQTDDCVSLPLNVSDSACHNESMFIAGPNNGWAGFPTIAKNPVDGSDTLAYIEVMDNGNNRLVTVPVGDTAAAVTGPSGDLEASYVFVADNGDVYAGAYDADDNSETLIYCGTGDCDTSAPSTKIDERWPDDCGENYNTKVSSASAVAASAAVLVAAAVIAM